MTVIGRFAATGFALLVGAGASQAPEFAQQYRQRLGGAVNELARVVERFDRDAAAGGLTRDAAIARLELSGDRFIIRRGASVRNDAGRLERLAAHAARLEATSPSVRPLVVARHGDGPILRATLAIYEPALPLTASGATYGLPGVFAALLAWWGIAALIRTAFRRAGRSRPTRQEPAVTLASVAAKVHDAPPIIPANERRGRRAEPVHERRRAGWKEGTP